MKHTYATATLFLVAVLVVGALQEPAAQSKSSGELIFAWHVTLTPAWFDPLETPAQITPFGILYALHDAVVRSLPGASMAPALAESWSESPDGLTYEFKLRPGLKFHNGDTCTAEDVQFSFARYRGTGAKELHSKVQRVEVVDALTVRFHLHEPWPDFMPFYGTTATGAGLVVPKKYLEQVGDDGFKKHPIGLGPYKFVSYTAGGELVLEAYEGYWRKVPHIKRLVMKSVPEGATRLAMLKNGEADFALALEGSVAEEVWRDPRLTLLYTLHASNQWLEFPEQWNPKSVWADKRVRLAVNYAIDRQAINEAACLGYCPPAGVIVPRVMEYALPAEPMPYDPKKARQLLAEAGYPNGFEAGELAPIPPFFVLGEAVVNALHAVGIRVRMRTMERAAFLTAWREKKLPSLFIAGAGTSGNAATRAEAFICSKGAFAAGGYPDIDALCQQQASERNHTRREALLYHLQQLTVERVMFAPIIDFRALVGLGPRVVDHAINTIPMHAFPAWEDIQLKGQVLTATALASTPPSPQTGVAGGSAEVPSPAKQAVLDQAAFVVRGGVVTPQYLQKSVTGYIQAPGVTGFSVQLAPKKTSNELAAAGRFSSPTISVATLGELQAAAQSVGAEIGIVAAPGRGFHHIVVTPMPLPDTLAAVLSRAFRHVPNPVPRRVVTTQAQTVPTR